MILSIETLRKLINRKIVLHFIFWLALLILVFAAENWEHGKFEFNFFIQYTIAFIIFIFAAYFNIYVLVPKYIKTRRYITYSVLLVILIVSTCSFIVLIRHLSFSWGFFEIYKAGHHDDNHIKYFFHILLGEGMLIVITSLMYILEEWIRFQDITIKINAIEKEKVQSELQALKAQINPHFLFNTLNNIYSHSLDKSPKVPEMILKLSDLMSYILYECKDDMVPIENEIAFLKNYIELEKLRYEDRLNVELNIGGEVNDLKIAPLLLISFVENAFKHIGNRFGKRPFVTIDLSFIDGTINLKIVNSVSQEIEKNGKEGGVGIENVKKRLELLYPEKYRLGIEKTENEFIVNLNIG